MLRTLLSYTFLFVLFHLFIVYFISRLCRLGIADVAIELTERLVGLTWRTHVKTPP